MEKLRMEEVFKKTGFPRYTYAVREENDFNFKSALLDGGSIVYLHGDSKTGKSSMWKNYINKDDCIEIKVTKVMDCNSLYAELVDKTRPFTKVAYEESTENEASVGIKGGVRGTFFKASGSLENIDTLVNKTLYERVASPGLSLTTVTQAAEEAGKVIILEDFQVASIDFIHEVANVLKAFADSEIKVIIVGIENKIQEIIKGRADLAGRITLINLSRFKRSALEKIISKGEKTLNIKFSYDVIDFLIGESFESAYILQSLLRNLCLIENIRETQKEIYDIDNITNAEKASQLLVESIADIYESTVQDIVNAATKKNKYDTYRWILRVLKDDIIYEGGGIPAQTIASNIKNHVPEFNPAGIYQCLAIIDKKQNTKFLRYEDKRLFIDDRQILLYLKWADWDK